MAFHSAKESLTREEVLDILRRNVALYKNEPEFVNYIVDLALFLLEHLAESEEKDPEARKRIREEKSIPVFQLDNVPVDAEKETPLPPLMGKEGRDEGESKMPRVLIDKGGRTRVYKVYRPHTVTNEGAHCPICGSETRGLRNCPNCGHVL